MKPSVGSDPPDQEIKAKRKLKCQGTRKEVHGESVLGKAVEKVSVQTPAPAKPAQKHASLSRATSSSKITVG